MTHAEFNHLMASVDALSADQIRRLLRELEGRMAKTNAPAEQTPSARASSGRSRREKAAAVKPPRGEAEVLQHMLDTGLITRLPDTAADFDDPDDRPISIKGEPLSETVIRERR